MNICDAWYLDHVNQLAQMREAKHIFKKQEKLFNDVFPVIFDFQQRSKSIYGEFEIMTLFISGVSRLKANRNPELYTCSTVNSKAFFDLPDTDITPFKISVVLVFDGGYDYKHIRNSNSIVLSGDKKSYYNNDGIVIKGGSLGPIMTDDIKLKLLSELSTKIGKSFV